MPFTYSCEECAKVHTHKKGYVFLVATDDGLSHYFCDVNCYGPWKSKVHPNPNDEIFVDDHAIAMDNPWPDGVPIGQAAEELQPGDAAELDPATGNIRPLKIPEEVPIDRRGAIEHTRRKRAEEQLND